MIDFKSCLHQQSEVHFSPNMRHNELAKVAHQQMNRAHNAICNISTFDVPNDAIAHLLTKPYNKLPFNTITDPNFQTHEPTTA